MDSMNLIGTPVVRTVVRERLVAPLGKRSAGSSFEAGPSATVLGGRGLRGCTTTADARRVDSFVINGGGTASAMADHGAYATRQDRVRRPPE